MQGFDINTAPDIASIEEEGQVIHLRDARDDLMYYGEGDDRKPVTVTVAGTYSNTYRDIVKTQSRRVGKRIGHGGDFLEFAEEDALERVAGCVLAWDGFFASGKPLPCTTTNVSAVLSSPKAQHIRTQVERAMSNHERFFSTRSAS